jgi:hypothetical protein
VTEGSSRGAHAAVVLGYLAATLFVTWPLPVHLTSSFPSDLGDPVFVAWVMAWVSRHVTAMLGGDLGAWGSMWDAPIFAPEHGTLTYSEHFLGQTLPLLPVYWTAGNPVLLYNLAFLASFVLSGVAAHGLTRRLTGSHLGGAVAGLTFAFGGYRMLHSISHLHTLSVQWWVFALWALDCYAAARTKAALLAVVLCLIGLNLSSSYFMAFTPPLTAAFAIWALVRHGRLRDGRAWVSLAVAGVISIAAVAPVIAVYLRVSRELGFERSLGEVTALSVSWMSYRFALPWLLPIVALMLVGVVAPVPGTGLSRRARLGLLALTVVTFWMAMGPSVTLGRWSVPGPYALLYAFVPGFTGLRVVSRYVALALVFAAILSGAGAVWLARWRVGVVVVLALTAAATATAWQRPFVLDGPLLFTNRFALPPPYLRPLAAPPRLYQFVRTLPHDAVVVELPFGDIGYDIRFTYFTQAHERRELNGYSGVLPPSYLTRAKVLNEPLRDLDASWSALAPATHAIVHDAAWPDDTGSRLRAWLESRGARVVVANVEGAWIYALPLR